MLASGMCICCQMHEPHLRIEFKIRGALDVQVREKNLLPHQPCLLNEHAPRIASKWMESGQQEIFCSSSCQQSTP